MIKDQCCAKCKTIYVYKHSYMHDYQQSEWRFTFINEKSADLIRYIRRIKHVCDQSKHLVKVGNIPYQFHLNLSRLRRWLTSTQYRVGRSTCCFVVHMKRCWWKKCTIVNWNFPVVRDVIVKIKSFICSVVHKVARCTGETIKII